MIRDIVQLSGRDVVQLAGPAITLLGVLLSAWGTFLLTRESYMFGLADFAKWGFLVTFLSLTGKVGKARQLIKAFTLYSQLNDDDLSKLTRKDDDVRLQYAVGLLVIFAGFILQGLGAIFWGVDMVWGIHDASLHSVGRPH